MKPRKPTIPQPSTLSTKSASFFPTLDRLLDLYNDLADGKPLPEGTNLPELLAILRSHRTVFLPYIDTDLTESLLLAAV